MSSVRPPAEGDRAATAATIFVSDPSAEAERVAQALRAEGFVVVDVPLSMLVSRAAVQPPRVILGDADAEEILTELAKLREIPSCEGTQVLLLGTGDEERADNAVKEGHAHAFFVRPVDVPDVARKAVVLAGGVPPIAPRPSTPPPSIPSSRQSAGALPPASMRAEPGPSVEVFAIPAPRAPSIPPPSPSSAAPPESLRKPPVQGPLSPELEQLLADAEQRVGVHLAPDSFPTPEDELEAVLPAEVLASLDEPIDEDEDEDDAEPAFGGHNSRGTTSGGGRQLTTGAGRPPTAPGRLETRPPEPQRRPASEAPRTASGGTFTGSTGARGLMTESAFAAGTREGTVRPDTGPSSGHSHVESAPPAPPPVPSLPLGPSTPNESPRAPTLPPPTSALPSPFSDARLAPAPPVPSIEALPATGPRSEQSTPGPASPVFSPVLLARGDAPRVLAQAIASRATGALCFEAPGVAVRRAVLREGDIVTAASGVDGENLLAFLGARGELPREQVDRLAGKLPPFGRHAGAALVAHGHLRQDQLWPVLRAHAEWLLSHMLSLESGTVQLEPEPPGRLKGEPSVFGGATGSEVFVELLRRVVSPEEAVERLGGPHVRVSDGPNATLLPECALPPQDAELLQTARGASLRTILDRAPGGDIAAVIYALSLLGVVEMVRAIAPEPVAPMRGAIDAPQRLEPGAIDALDEDALRARVRARLQLIEEGDYFAVLGIARDATGYEVRRAFLELRRDFEPAKLLTPRLADLGQDVRKIAVVLDEAYEILKDSARRERYRRAIEGRPS